MLHRIQTGWDSPWFQVAQTKKLKATTIKIQLLRNCNSSDGRLATGLRGFSLHSQTRQSQKSQNKLDHTKPQKNVSGKRWASIYSNHLWLAVLYRLEYVPDINCFGLGGCILPPFTRTRKASFCSPFGSEKF